jgi:hypothetical protein
LWQGAAHRAGKVALCAASLVEENVRMGGAIQPCQVIHKRYKMAAGRMPTDKMIPKFFMTEKIYFKFDQVQPGRARAATYHSGFADLFALD